METSFKLLGNRLTLTGPTPPEDALWLAASLPTLPAGTRVLDAGTGSGIAALALLTRQPHLVLTGIDINPSLIAHATANACRNNLNLTATPADLLTYKTNPFPVIISNPPFHAQSRGHTTPNAQKSLAHSMPENMLTAWLTAFHGLLAPHGSIHLILHIQCEEELLRFAKAHTYATTLTPLQTSANGSPKRLLVHMQAAAKRTLTLQTPIPIYKEDLRTKVLKNAQALT